MNVKGALTRKIGPLPAWGWGVAIGGALLAVKMMRGGIGGGGGGTKTATIYVPTGNEVGSSDFASQLGDEFAQFREDVGDSLDDLRDEIADVQSPSTPPPSGEQPPSKPSVPSLPKPSVPQPTTPPTTKPPTIFTVGTRTFGLLADAQAFAKRIIRDYSPGGALYGKGMAGRPATRNAIPIIPTSVLTLAQQRELAAAHKGTLLVDVK